VFKRYEGKKLKGQQKKADSWAVVIDNGYKNHKVTGKRVRDQSWITVKGTKADADRKLVEVLGAVNTKTFVKPTKLTFGAFLDSWLENRVKPMMRPRTFAT
jgi:hypothetical protein